MLFLENRFLLSVTPTTFIYLNHFLVVNTGGFYLDKKKLFIAFIVVFSLGWILNSALTNFIYYDPDKSIPFSFSPVFVSKEIESPSNHIKEEQIHIYSDKVILDIPNAKWASFTDTNSMDPLLDETSNSIELSPKQPSDINEGDIISYHSKITGSIIVHRVIDISTDNKGVYYIVKGDNNPIRDPEKIRFEQIHGVLVGVIY